MRGVVCAFSELWEVYGAGKGARWYGVLVEACETTKRRLGCTPKIYTKAAGRVWRDAHLADPKWTTALPPANHHATNTKRIFEIAEPDQGTKDMVRRSGGSLVGRTASDDAPERGRGGACAADGARRAPSAAHRDLMGKPTYRRMRGSVRPAEGTANVKRSREPAPPRGTPSTMAGAGS